MTTKRLFAAGRPRPEHLDVLLIDSDDIARTGCAAWLSSRGCRVRPTNSLSAAATALRAAAPDLALIQLVLPDGNGMELLEKLRTAGSALNVALVEGGDVDLALQALDGGAVDYLFKPIELDRLSLILEKVRRNIRRRETHSPESEAQPVCDSLCGLDGSSRIMRSLYAELKLVSCSDETVFIFGATGTGKEIAAQTVHALSKRSASKFVGVNCSAISPALLESELFGHERGAFTGADRKRLGLFEQARGGTLFLDEITELPIGLQAKLLRVLETRLMTRVGGNDQIQIDVRLLAASNCDPVLAVSREKLREDLLYRLFVCPIRMPSLSERREDIPVLAESILSKLNLQYRGAKRFTHGATSLMKEQDWPGNIRQLSNAIRRAYVLAESEIQARHIEGCGGPERSAEVGPVSGECPGYRNQDSSRMKFRVGESISAVERRLLESTLLALDGDKRRAAHMLGISLKTLYARLNVYSASNDAPGLPSAR